MEQVDMVQEMEIEKVNQEMEKLKVNQAMKKLTTKEEMDKTSGEISIFRGKYFFLSTLYLSDIKYQKYVYNSVEHIYQTARCAEKSDKEKMRNVTTPKAAKILGKFIKPRPYWDVEKMRAMSHGNELKFLRHPKLRKKLIKTGNKQLINQNYWHDTYWGVCGCTKHKKTGMNLLGKILMKIRSEML
ncbi:uncharacterized protein F44E2.8-like [Sitodiplosis mosellana]|uniref:uncharacterized protein F44E2.8-like n=1 Tax=Sitodiplosis mosellana TaxID=263140 RepID=UPI002444978C|nr:uncharacterized protein F44E2.8-like [Sitodiplosis mosellana]